MTPELEIKRAAAKAELAAIEAEIDSAVIAARSGNITAVRALMSAHGLTVADLGPAAAVERKPKASKPTIAPMYISDAGKTYAGRGKHPHWLRDAMAAGRTLESFRIGA